MQYVNFCNKLSDDWKTVDKAKRSILKVDQVKYLCLVIDNKLSFVSHINKLNTTL